MLDSKDQNYIIEVLNLVDLLMTKIPDKYIISFIREGVANNIQQLSTAKQDELIIYND